ncbi:aspartate-semialdehyde dehydrogenase [Marinisporobacter balticus]|uniref:Aspartate-semialdehyde dehydrogenase n=1 Tax=Marinisporobacter balticus TaxID=2018667 RepID=A0A4R2KEL3_9FIRM|nr:aspartate-semialdehyde dehydrogenase [Marinisporobacter balticus]TCO71454.1 aspartate-semialdehyde dehydrogenase [Marinisporobacter balticus]
MKKYNVAVVGALGAVGQEMIKTLEQRNFPVHRLKPLDIASNKGKEVFFNGEKVYVETAEKGAFEDVDIALFSAGGDASTLLAPIAVEENTIVIDNSSAWRMDPTVPLVVPEVNPEDLDSHKGLISNPNCSTIQMMVALKPIHDAYTIKRIVVSTYQAVSGSGQKAINELNQQAKDYASAKKMVHTVYPYQIAFNALPHIDIFMDNGYTKEEMKMVNETKKILCEDIKISATTVRVPVFRCHSESINIEVEKKIDIDNVIKLLTSAAGITVQDCPKTNTYPLAIDVAGKDDVFIGRIRKDFSIENGLNMWVVSDNLRKGAALNAVQIAETLVQRNLL